LHTSQPWRDPRARTLKLFSNHFFSAYAATPTTLKIIDLYVIYAVFTALIQVAYMAIVGSFPFNSFLSGVFLVSGQLSLLVVSGSKLIKKTRNSRIWHRSELLQISSCATWFSIW
ncbi:hypothetical protein KFY57_27160, partial [Salmonella enterica subsp. enterica serovar Typhimurium]|nr:hypothetical protein [Salmonella enterica subsp. enterica serovar Typhimurium]